MIQVPAAVKQTGEHSELLRVTNVSSDSCLQTSRNGVAYLVLTQDKQS